MRFRFCGDLDCPDWVLAEIATLSKITSVKMKLLCAQVIKDIIGQGIDYAKVHQLTADAKFETGDIKACVAVLHFILCNAAKHSVNESSLSDEIQQLGLPKEHAIALCKLYADNYKALQAKLTEETLKLSQVDSIHWRVNYVISSSHLKEVDAPTAELRFVLRNAEDPELQSHSFALTGNKLQILLHEMKQLHSMMSALE